MPTNAPMFRLTAALTTAALLLGSTAMTMPVRAQPAPPVLQPEQNEADPPMRVGRLAATAGPVSYHVAGDTQWTAATMNFPVATGSAFWAEPGSRAELELSASRIGMAGGTEIDIGALDAAGLQATLTQGEIVLRPRDLAPGETWTVQTPRGTVTTSRAGRIAIVAGDTEAPTVISVLDGEATIAGPDLTRTLTAGQAATIAGTGPFTASFGAAVPDAFARAETNRDRPPLPPPANQHPVPPPPAIASLPGGEELTAHGVWAATPDYGEVWYPSVDPDWVPYRQGHWAFIVPWGWTWVDDAPWGFAPFHYGRWVRLHDRWAWTPGEAHISRGAYPVYAPALVTFVGIGAGVALGAALAAGSIGWIPLGPREQYHPWYHASARYVGGINAGPTTAVANPGNYRNHAAATMVPANAMTSSQPIRPVAAPIGAQNLAGAQTLSGSHPVRPTSATAGVTQGVVQQLHPASGGSGTIHAAAPGPSIAPHAVAPAGVAPPLPAPHPAPLPGPAVPAQTPQHPAVQPNGAAPAGQTPGPVAPRRNPAEPAAPPPHPAPPVVQQPSPQGAPPPPHAVAPAAPPSRPLPPVMQPPPSQVTAPPHLAPPVVQQPAPPVAAPPPHVVAPAAPPPRPAPPVVQQPPPQVAPPPLHVAPQAAPPPRPAPPVVQQPPPPHVAAPPPHERKPGEH